MAEDPTADWTLRGGLHPETAALSTTLADRGLVWPTTGEPVGEHHLLGLGGGLGAGYILWEFEAREGATVTTGFRRNWQYPDRWCHAVADRIGVSIEMVETGGAKKAAAQLGSILDAGRPAICWVSAPDVGWWFLPPEDSGHWGYPVVAIGRSDDRLVIDDRNVGRLTVDATTFADARGRISSYRHRLVDVVDVPDALDESAVRRAVTQSLAENAEHLLGSSDSFQLRAFRKWARLVNDTDHAKAWRRVFRGGRGLYGTLLTCVEATTEIGGLGGNLRGLYAAFVDDAAELLGVEELTDVAASYRELDDEWHAFADLCAPADIPAFDDGAMQLATRRMAVAEGDAGAATARAASERLSELRAEHDVRFPMGGPDTDALFVELSGQLQRIYELEVAVATRLGELVGPPGGSG